MPETTPRRPHLAHHDHRRTARGGEPGRTPGDDSAIQRGWLNPDHQLFGQVTSRARQQPLYDAPPGHLTRHSSVTEAPKGTDLSVHSPRRLREVATELNDRPRKTVGGITPAHAMQRLLLDPESPLVATTA